MEIQNMQHKLKMSTPKSKTQRPINQRIERSQSKKTPNSQVIFSRKSLSRKQFGSVSARRRKSFLPSAKRRLSLNPTVSRQRQRMGNSQKGKNSSLKRRSIDLKSAKKVTSSNQAVKSYETTYSLDTWQTDSNSIPKLFSLRDMTLLSLGPPQRATRSVKSSASKQFPNTFSLDQVGLSSTLKKQYQEIVIRSTPKSSSNKRRYRESFYQALARNLFAECNVTPPKSSSFAAAPDTIMLETREEIQKEENREDEKQNDNLDDDLFSLLSPATKKLIEYSKQNNSVDSSNSLLNNCTKQQPQSSQQLHSIAFEMEDEELTGVVSRIIAQTPIKLTPLKTSSQFTKPSSSINMDISIHERNGAENPVSKILSNDRNAYNDHLLMSRMNSKKILSFANEQPKQPPSETFADETNSMIMSPCQ